MVAYFAICPWTGRPSNANPSTTLHTLELQQLVVNFFLAQLAQLRVIRPTPHLPRRGFSSVQGLNLLWVASHFRTTDSTSSTPVESLVTPRGFKQLVKNFSDHKAHKAFQQWSESLEDQGSPPLAITFECYPHSYNSEQSTIRMPLSLNYFLVFDFSPALLRCV